MTKNFIFNIIVNNNWNTIERKRNVGSVNGTPLVNMRKVKILSFSSLPAVKKLSGLSDVFKTY